MEVEHGLCCSFAVVDHDSVAILKPFLRRHLGSGQKEVP
eukprot:CAMPEP_0171626700 /NCGR_PEP_ID=MMETSP0990-20121206/20232_1 /TAXON_ID=483369 /ORGANISM="non described non described, Strain CCMP2098" /LENGTH=38 /DNA_ID= /DNA_START= /DNA_END= /DNA_ORIENTATION=